eukprot:63759-Chlamydomonas_euryale.AAC.1
MCPQRGAPPLGGCRTGAPAPAEQALGEPARRPPPPRRFAQRLLRRCVRAPVAGGGTHTGPRAESGPGSRAGLCDTGAGTPGAGDTGSGCAGKGGCAAAQ